MDKHRAEVLTDAVNDILLRDGAAALTLRTIGREARVSPSSIVHHLGSRERLLRVAANITSRQHLDDIDSRSADGVLAHLPKDDGNRNAALWLAWAELARAESTLWSTVGKWHLDECATFARHFIPPTGEGRQPRPDRLAVDTSYAVLIGLRAALTRHLEPITIDRARELLTVAYDHHRPLPQWL